jgi:predicted NBD/HSP70 family sugar kinase
MLKAIVSFHDGSEPQAVKIGQGEDVKAPTALAALRAKGWEVTPDVELTYKAWMALKRQGDVPADSKFDDWVDNVEEVAVQLSDKQITEAVLVGGMTQEQADQLRALYASQSGEAQGQPA